MTGFDAVVMLKTGRACMHCEGMAKRYVDELISDLAEPGRSLVLHLLQTLRAVDEQLEPHHWEFGEVIDSISQALSPVKLHDILEKEES